jgi:hypothetical protein
VLSRWVCSAIRCATVQANSRKSVCLPMYRRMSLLLEHGGDPSVSDEIEISDAAICGYGRLLRAISGTVITHATYDGGLICEHRARAARPTLWRISSDGAVVPDSPYSFLLGAFVTASLPLGI